MLLKIFIVMGVTYFFEFFGFILSWIYGHSERIENYFIANNIVNALQGVFIFVVLICKRPILKKLVNQCMLCKKSLILKPSVTKMNANEPELDHVSNHIDMNPKQSTDMIALSKMSGKYSTSSIISHATSVTNISSA